jgi:hypothetical protein
MNAIANLINHYRGYLHERGGIVNGFFDDPQDAAECAEQMRRSFGLNVELSGCQLSFVDRRRNADAYPAALERRKTVPATP